MIQKKCCFPQCKNSASDGYRLFAVTKRKRTALKWLERCNLPKSTPVSSALCEGHFGRDMYEMIDVHGALRLKAAAYPNVLEPNPPRVVETKGREQESSNRLVHVTLDPHRMFSMEDGSTHNASVQDYAVNMTESMHATHFSRGSGSRTSSFQTPLQSFINNEQFSALDDDEPLPLNCVLTESESHLAPPELSETLPQSHISNCSHHPSAAIEPIDPLLARLVQAEAAKISLEDRIQLLEDRNKFLEDRAQSLENENQQLRDKVCELTAEVNAHRRHTNNTELPEL